MNKNEPNALKRRTRVFLDLVQPRLRGCKAVSTRPDPLLDLLADSLVSIGLLVIAIGAIVYAVWWCV